MDSAGARSSETHRQDQRRSAYVTSSGRQDGDQARDVSAPIPSHQSEEQELWTRTPQSTSLTREQEWSEQVPAAVRPSETEEWHVQPPQPLQILDAPRPENSVLDRLWDWWNEDPPQRWQVDQWRWNARASSQTENQQNCDWNQWSSRHSSNDWNWWSSWATRADDERWSSWTPWSHSVPSESKKYFDKSPPPEWDGSQPRKTWRDYRRMLKQWLSTTDVPIEKHGMLLWRALTGDAKLLISHFRDDELLRWDAGQRMFDVLVQAHKHICEFEDQDDFDNAFYKLHRERNQTLLQFANVARAAYLKHDSHGHPLPDRTMGMIFLRPAKIPGHLEDHIVAKTNGSRNFSDLLEAIQVLARRPMSQTSSSYPSFNDDWTDSTYD